MSYMKFFSVFLIFLSVIFGLSSTSILAIWVFLELNLISFVIYTSLSAYNSSKESMIQYFLIQAIGSMLLVLVVLSVEFGLTEGLSSFSLSAPLIIKLGLPPFHSWFISFLSASSWDVLFFASSVQKLLPFSILCLTQACSISWLLFMAAVASLGSLRQNWLKKFLAYSSIFSGCWLVSVASKFSLGVMFLTIYCVGLAVVSLQLYFSSVATIDTSFLSMNFTCDKALMSLGLLNLAGLPPMLGFLGKLWASLEIFNISNFLMLFLLTSSALILCIYLHLIIVSLTQKRFLPFLAKQYSPFPLLMSVLLLLPIMVMFLHLGV